MAEKIDPPAAEMSARPADFANASPFRVRKAQSDRSRTLLFLAAGVAVLLLIAALVAAFTT